MRPEKENFLKFLVLCLAIGNVQSAVDSSCNSQWQAFSRCMKLQSNRDNDIRTGVPKPENSISGNVQVSLIRACFKENYCRDPLAPETHTKIRETCFPPALTGLRSELQACGKQSLWNFQLPEDELSDAKQSNDVLFLQVATAIQNFQSLCPSNINQGVIKSCVARKYSTSGLTKTSSVTQNYCDIVSQCKSQSFMTSSCYNAWDSVLCPCVQNIRSTGVQSKYENQYIDCMRRHGMVVDRNTDPAMVWFTSSLNGFCGSISIDANLNSWTPQNKFCGSVPETTNTIAENSMLPWPQSPQVPVTVQLPENQEIQPDPNNQDWGQNSDQSGNWGQMATTTEHPWFFDQFHYETQEDAPPTTTPLPPPVTHNSNWPSFLSNLGIQDPREGVWGQIFNINNWLGRSE